MTIRRLLFASLLMSALLGALLALGCAEPPARDDARAVLARWEDRRLADADSLAALIADDDAHVRRAALRCAGLIGRTDVLPAVLDAVDDPSDAVRAEAARALGLIGDEAAADPLAAMVAGDHARVRRAALFALARVPHDGAALWDPALHGEPADAAAAWTALRDRAADLDSTRLAEAVRSGLVRSEPDVLWRVLRCAERTGSREIVPEVAAFTTHRHAQVRVHACRALGRIGGEDPAALDAVLEAIDDLGRFSSRDADRVRIAALRALGALAPARLATDGEHVALVTALTAHAHAESPHVSRCALDAMNAAVADMPLPAEAAERESLLPVWRIRLLQSARKLLVRFDEAGEPDLHASPEPVVRAAAAAAVCALRGEGLMADLDLRGVVGDPAPQVKDAATIGLARHVLPPERFLAAAATARPDAPARVLLAATSVMADALARYEAEGRPAALVDSVRTVTQGILRFVLADGAWAPAAQSADLLGAHPSDRNLEALIAAWDTAEGWTAPDIRMGVLGAFAAFFPEDGTFAPADSLAAQARRVLEEGFDSPDVRQRLRARTVALASGLVPATAVPGEASLKATVPAHVRHADQGTVALPFDAPEVRCVTDRGTFTIRLDGRRAPNTCATFLELIRRGFFDGLAFHRVVPDFVIQGGDPDGTGWGGPGFTIRSEWSDAPYERGTVGIAHSGKDTGGSQFFVAHSAQPHLDGRYTVFGKVVDGMEIVDLVQPDDTFRLEIVEQD